MNVSSSKLVATLAVSTLLAQFAVAQGNPAQDIATTGGVSQITLKPGASRGAPEGANVIFNNGPFINAPGGGAGGLDASVLQNTSRSHNVIGYSVNGASTVPTGTRYHLAEDFTVPDGQMWYVDSVKVWLYRTSSVGLVWNDAIVRVWDGDPSTGLANILFGDLTTNRIRASTFDLSYRVTETTLPAINRELHEVEIGIGRLFKPGTYWIEWGVNLLTTPTGTVFAPPITITGVDNTGNGKQASISTAGVATWTNLLMNGPGGLNAHPQGMPFVLCGEIACCFENDMGPALTPNGDDVKYAALAVPSFAMPGGLGNTTSIDVCTNGYVNLQANLLGADYSPSVAQLLAESARICVPWQDFHSGLNGNVRMRTTALRTIVTWERIATYNTAGTQSIVQLQLFPNGSFTINSWVVIQGASSWNTPIFGVSPGNGAADPGETDFSVAMPFSTATGTVYELFSNSAGADLYDLNGRLICFVPNAGGGYDVSSTPACCTFASSAPIAPGCHGMTTFVVANAIAGGTAILNTTLPPGTVGQVTLLGLFPAPGFIDLGPAGAPGCFVHHTNDLFAVPMDGAGVTLIPLPCLAALLGFPLPTQGVAITPGINALNVALADAWALTIGNL